VVRPRVPKFVVRLTAISAPEFEALAVERTKLPDDLRKRACFPFPGPDPGPLRHEKEVVVAGRTCLLTCRAAIDAVSRAFFLFVFFFFFFFFFFFALARARTSRFLLNCSAPAEGLSAGGRPLAAPEMVVSIFLKSEFTRKVRPRQLHKLWQRYGKALRTTGPYPLIIAALLSCWSLRSAAGGLRMGGGKERPLRPWLRFFPGPAPTLSAGHDKGGRGGLFRQVGGGPLPTAELSHARPNSFREAAEVASP